MAPQLEDEDGIAIPPAPNWYGSALADWGMGSNAIYAYAARNAIVLLRPDGGKGSAPDRPTPQTSSSHSRPHSANVSFAGTLVGHNNRVTALAFARYPGVEHLLLSGSADRTLRLWDVADGRCVRILRGHGVDVTAVATSPRVPDLAVSGDKCGKCLVWRFGGGGGDGPIRALEPLDGSPVLCLAMSPHPRRDEVACGQQSGALGVYVLSGDDVVKRRLPARSGDAQACAWLPWPATGTSEEGNERGLQEGTSGGDDPRMVLAVGGRERAVTLWSWDGARTSLRKTLSLPRCPPHLSEAQRGRLWLSLAWSTVRDPPVGDPNPVGGPNAGDKKSEEGTSSTKTVHLVTASHGGDLLRWTLDVNELVGDASLDNAPIAVDKFGPPDKAHARTVFLA
jgi:gem associated protein 5